MLLCVCFHPPPVFSLPLIPSPKNLIAPSPPTSLSSASLAEKDRHQTDCLPPVYIKLPCVCLCMFSVLRSVCWEFFHPLHSCTVCSSRHGSFSVPWMWGLFSAALRDRKLPRYTILHSSPAALVLLRFLCKLLFSWKTSQSVSNPWIGEDLGWRTKSGSLISNCLCEWWPASWQKTSIRSFCIDVAQQRIQICAHTRGSVIRVVKQKLNLIHSATHCFFFVLGVCHAIVPCFCDRCLYSKTC